MMARSGVQLLVNERAEVRLPGGRLLIGGVDECNFGQPDGRDVYKRQLLRRAPSGARARIPGWACPKNEPWAWDSRM